MPDYKTMYFSLFNTITDVIELLKAAQMHGEKQFIEDEPPLALLFNPLPKTPFMPSKDKVIPCLEEDCQVHIDNTVPQAD